MSLGGWLFFFLLNISILPQLPTVLWWSEMLNTALEETVHDHLILLASQAIIGQVSNSHGQVLGWRQVGHGGEGSYLPFGSGKLGLDFLLSSQHSTVSSDITWCSFLISKIKIIMTLCAGLWGYIVLLLITHTNTVYMCNIIYWNIFKEHQHKLFKKQHSFISIILHQM